MTDLRRCCQTLTSAPHRPDCVRRHVGMHPCAACRAEPGAVHAATCQIVRERQGKGPSPTPGQSDDVRARESGPYDAAPDGNLGAWKVTMRGTHLATVPPYGARDTRALAQQIADGLNLLHSTEAGTAGAGASLEGFEHAVMRGGDPAEFGMSVTDAGALTINFSSGSRWCLELGKVLVDAGWSPPSLGEVDHGAEAAERFGKVACGYGLPRGFVGNALRDLARHGVRLVGGKGPGDPSATTGYMVDALCRLLEEQGALGVDCAKLAQDMHNRGIYMVTSDEIDPPVTRIQFPDGSGPGNAREAAEGWYRHWVEARADANRGKALHADTVRSTAWVQERIDRGDLPEGMTLADVWGLSCGDAGRLICNAYEAIAIAAEADLEVAQAANRTFIAEAAKLREMLTKAPPPAEGDLRSINERANSLADRLVLVVDVLQARHDPGEAGAAMRRAMAQLVSHVAYETRRLVTGLPELPVVPGDWALHGPSGDVRLRVTDVSYGPDGATASAMPPDGLMKITGPLESFTRCAPPADRYAWHGAGEVPTTGHRANPATVDLPGTTSRQQAEGMARRALGLDVGRHDRGWPRPPAYFQVEVDPDAPKADFTIRPDPALRQPAPGVYRPDQGDRYRADGQGVYEGDRLIAHCPAADGYNQVEPAREHAKAIAAALNAVDRMTCPHCHDLGNSHAPDCPERPTLVDASRTLASLRRVAEMVDTLAARIEAAHRGSPFAEPVPAMVVNVAGGQVPLNTLVALISAQVERGLQRRMESISRRISGHR